VPTSIQHLGVFFRKMQLVATLVLGFLLHTVSSLTVALAAAKVWLHNHQAPPSQDELAELKTENPEAYAIVKSLLVKHSLGLLNPKHPSASFSGPAATDDSAPATEATEVTASAAPAQHDWLNWKPQNNAANDDAMVKSVLGEVATLKAQPQNDVPSDATKNSDTSLEWKDPQQPAVQQVQQVAQLEAQPVAQTAVAGPVAPSATQQQDHLTTLKWDDEAPPRDLRPSLRATQLAPASISTDAAPKQEPRIDAAPKQESHTNALLSWLGGNSESYRISKVPVQQEQER